MAFLIPDIKWYPAAHLKTGREGSRLDGISGPNPLLNQGYLELVSQDHDQTLSNVSRMETPQPQHWPYQSWVEGKDHFNLLATLLIEPRTLLSFFTAMAHWWHMVNLAKLSSKVAFQLIAASTSCWCMGLFLPTWKRRNISRTFDPNPKLNYTTAAFSQAWQV